MSAFVNAGGLHSTAVTDDDVGREAPPPPAAKTPAASVVFAATIRSLREERGWSQEELARRVTAAGYKISQSRMATMEAPSGEPRTISLDQAAAIASAFDMPLRDLLGGPKFAEVIELARRVERREKELFTALITARNAQQDYADLMIDIGLRDPEEPVPGYEVKRVWMETRAQELGRMKEEVNQKLGLPPVVLAGDREFLLTETRLSEGRRRGEHQEET